GWFLGFGCRWFEDAALGAERAWYGWCGWVAGQHHRHRLPVDGAEYAYQLGQVRGDDLLKHGGGPPPGQHASADALHVSPGVDLFSKEVHQRLHGVECQSSSSTSSLLRLLALPMLSIHSRCSSCAHLNS